MEFRHIRYFLAVAEERNFTRAAAKVGIGQSPLSQQIKDLEREVGALLFHRVAHGAELTAAGESFLAAVRGMPAIAERAIHDARRAARGEVGQLAIGFTASAAFNAAVLDAIRGFRSAYPDVRLELEEANTGGLLAGLHGGSLDAAFLRPGAAGTEAIKLRPICDEVMLAALPAAHPVAGKTVVRLADLADEPLLLPPREVGRTLFDTVTAAFRAAGIEPRLGQTGPQVASVINLAAAGLGITLVPASMAQVAVGGLVYRIVADAPTIGLALATRRGDTGVPLRNFVAQAEAARAPRSAIPS